MKSKVRRKRVGALTVKITRGRDELIGIGDRFESQIEGRVTAVAATPGNLFVGSSRGVLVRLETQTGRQCARAAFDSAVTQLSISGAVVTATAGDQEHSVKATSLKPVKPRS